MNSAHSPSPQASQESLAGAFELFVQASQALEQQYAVLSRQVESLNADLLLAHQRMNTLLNALPAGVILVENGLVSHANQAAQDWISGIGTGAVWQIPAMWKPGVGPDEYHVDVNGQQATLQLLQVHDGSRSVIQIQDITANLKTLEENERLDRLAAMGKMSAGIAHQIRTPLATALLYASHIAQGSLTPDQQQTFATKLRTQLLNLEKMAREMLQFIRMKPIEPQWIGLNDLAQEAQQSLEALSAEKNIAIHLDLQSDCPQVHVEKPRVLSALVALLENALQISPPHTVITLSTRADSQHARWVITDQGPGISADMLPRLFEPFATSRSTGTGLGLAIAQNAIRSHRGDITAHNLPAGGACFTITLPCLSHW